jgi:all-trans-retinol dehydrogenase (NAD+)
MLDRNTGHIVTISSIAGQAGTPGMTHYNASKFACYGFSESLRTELKRMRKNIKCTTICPYYINTGMFAGVKTALLFPMLE